MYTLLCAGALGGLAGLCMSLYVLLVGLICEQQKAATGAISVSTYVSTWKLEFLYPF